MWAFWWPRFERIARWFVAFEQARRADGIAAAGERDRAGAAMLDGPAGAFALRGKADRIDAAGDGALAIIDYKTGSCRSGKQIARGFAPQLPLEADDRAAGGFAGIHGSTIADLAHVRLSGGRRPALSPRQCIAQRCRRDAGLLAVEAREGLLRRIAQFDRPRTAYLSRPRPEWLARDGAYDHLARVRNGRGRGRCCR